MIDLQLDITDLEDLKHEKNEFMQKDILELSQKHLGAGNRIVIKRSYLNAPDEFIKAFRSQDAFENFWESLFK